MRFYLHFPNDDRRECRTQLWGTHQLCNLTAAATAGYCAGMKVNDIISSVTDFRGVKRRLELKYSDGHRWIYDDFAHHPTAIRSAVSALRSHHPGVSVFAVFEPRSNTIVRRVLQDDLAEALSSADAVAIGKVYRQEKIPPDERLDVEQIADVIRLKGIEVFYHHKTDSLVRWLQEKANKQVVIVVMSSGSFGGLVDTLTEVFQVGNRS
jgi:UDP-N-acetylmuramate: L-alanyl-gamma-D-glutamyl-meso-diaminopimelate ligase